MRVGFLLLNGRASGWQLESVREAASRPGIEVLILDAHCDSASQTAPTIRRRLAVWLARLARAIEYWAFLRSAIATPELRQLLRQQDIGRAIAGTPMVLDAVLTGGDETLHFPPDALRKVAELSLDVIVSFAGPCVAALGQVPRFGMWQFHYADGQAVRRDLAVGFWEVYFGTRRTMVALELAAGDQLDRWILRRGWYQTEEASWTMNQLCAMEYARLMLGDSMGHLQRTGTLLQADLDNLDSAEQPQSRTPDALDYWMCLAKLACRRFKGIWLHRLFWEQWYLLIGPCARPLNTEPALLKRVASNSRVWWADPFLFTNGGKTWVFAEEKHTHRAHADICVFEWTGTTLERRGIALSPGYHVSYPFLFRHRDGIYMIPETSSSRAIEIWECLEFPLLWCRRRVMLEGLRAADSTLLQLEGRWWLFTNVSRSELIPNLCIELFVYSTDDPISGEWLEHEANPVVTDCRRSRMAGPFISDGADSPVFRVCQSNSRVYGESIVVCRVDGLSLTDYRESLVRVFEPGWNRSVIATHHLSSGGGLVVMDAMRRRLRALH